MGGKQPSILFLLEFFDWELACRKSWPLIGPWQHLVMVFDWALATSGRGFWFCLVALLPSSIGPGISKLWPSILAFCGLGSQHEHAFWIGLEVSIEAQIFVSCLSSPCLFRLGYKMATWPKAMLTFVLWPN